MLTIDKKAILDRCRYSDLNTKVKGMLSWKDTHPPSKSYENPFSVFCVSPWWS